MEVIGALALAVVAFGIALVHGGRAARSDKPTRWYGLAQACGLSEIGPVGELSAGVSGRLGDLPIQFTSERDGHVDTVLTVRGLAKLVVVRPESLGTRIDKALSGGEPQTGDAAFDQAAYVRGDELRLLALLDSETRDALLSAFSTLGTDGAPTDLELAQGELKATFASAPGGPDAVRPLLLLAQRLREPSDPIACLVASLERERLASVRRIVLDTLERMAPGRPETRSAMERAARTETDAEIRLRAALWLGRLGWPALHELAEDGSAPDTVSARAIEELGEQVALDRARRIVEQSMPVGRTLTARAAVSLLGGGSEGDAAFLAAILDRAVQQARREGIMAAAWEEVQEAAAEALGRVGSAASVPHLDELASRARGRVRSAALEAIARIRGRLTGVEPGRLALAEGAEGQVTLADDERGRVTLPDTDVPS